MTTRSAIIFVSLLALAGLNASACGDTPSLPASALALPVDFAYACEGDGVMVAPDNDETAAKLDNTRMCPDLDNGDEGELFGVALNRQPPGLIVLNLNPAAGTRGFLDADFFVPGTSQIPVGADPIQVLANEDHSAFFVLSVGDRQVDRIVIESHDADGIRWNRTTIPLPGEPGIGLVLGDTVLVAAADAPTVWSFSAAPDGTPLVFSTAVGNGQRLLAMDRIPGDDDAVLATFRDRASVARVLLDGSVAAEAGLVPACRDGLDNDGDGVIDRADGDCLDAGDDDESTATGAPRPAEPTVSLKAYDGAAPCEDEVDNDGDGLTDADDPVCSAAGEDGRDELSPACSDGIDNDGDGLTDWSDAKTPGGDPSCYAALGTFEGQLPADGPFHPAFVDAGAAGRFVYVLDERTGQIPVFRFTDASAFERVNVNAEDATPPALESVAFSDPTGEVREDEAIPAIRQPALFRRGLKDIEILEGNAFTLASSRLRGELWDRLIAPSTPGEAATVAFDAGAEAWKPNRCAPDRTDACAQPAHDDETWFLFGANLDGRLQMIEAVRRGVPVHRLAQREQNPSNRTMDVTAPRLTRRGLLVNARGEPQAGFPFVGAPIEELLVESDSGVSPAELRRFGIWPPDALEEAPSETWSITYEGRIPGASGRLGRFVTEAAGTATFFDAESTFCDEGVEAGDWLQITVPVTAASADLSRPLSVTLEDGTTCPTVAPTTATVEARVITVGMSTLTIDRATARLRPELPVLDLVAIEAQRLSRRACDQALDDLDDTLGLPENLVATTALAAANLPPRFAWSVRVADRWAAVGSRSGFLHRQVWNGTACLVDETLDSRFVGRINERIGAVASYASCPPPAEQLAEDTVDTLAPTASRFANPSFAIDIFPACERQEDGTIAALPSQQDTTFTFDLTGPYQGSALAISNSVLVTNVPMLDFRRQQVQLDASARRASILQMRVGDPRVIATFE